MKYHTAAYYTGKWQCKKIKRPQIAAQVQWHAWPPQPCNIENSQRKPGYIKEKKKAKVFFKEILKNYSGAGKSTAINDNCKRHSKVLNNNHVIYRL